MTMLDTKEAASSAGVRCRLALALAIMALAVWANTAHAQDAPESHPPGPRGGVLADAGAFHVEIMFKGGMMLTYLYDSDNKPVPVKEVKASATVLAKGQQFRITLAPSGPNELIGEAKLPVDPEAKSIVILDIPGQRKLQARFVVPTGQP